MILPELNILMDARERQRLGGQRSGNHAVKHKKGIHGLSNEQQRQNSKNGNRAFLEKWKHETYRDLHQKKIRLGKLISRFKRLPKRSHEDFGFSR